MTRILIIEDDDSFAEYLSECLPGSDRVIVNNWECAKNAIREIKFDAIILDYTLGREETLDWLRAHAPRSALICITGAAEELPSGYDEVNWKINLTKRHAIEHMVYSALHKRETKGKLMRSVEAVESCARLLTQYA